MLYWTRAEARQIGKNTNDDLKKIRIMNFTEDFLLKAASSLQRSLLKSCLLFFVRICVLQKPCRGSCILIKTEND